MSDELAGGALLLLAAFAPFTLLRLVPMVEAHAALQLEGVRHRIQHAALSGPRTAVSFALGRRAPEPLPDLSLGTGLDTLVEAPGGGASSAPTGAEPVAEPSAPGVPLWRGAARPPLAERRPAAGATTTAPLWGAPIGGSRRQGRRPGEHVIEHDGLGPVIAWHPEAGSPSGEGTDGR